MKKYITVEPKVGDYFKAEIDGYKVTGRVAEEIEYWNNNKSFLLLAFDNEEIDEGYNPEDNFGFGNSYSLENVEEIEIITKKEHKNLLKSPLYSDFDGYKVKLERGSKPQFDEFVFGCGAITVYRPEVEKLLKLFAVVKPSELQSLIDLLNKIEDKSGDTLQDGDIPKIKQLLSAV
jgi:hypothetical protein